MLLSHLMKRSFANVPSLTEQRSFPAILSAKTRPLLSLIWNFLIARVVSSRRSRRMFLIIASKTDVRYSLQLIPFVSYSKSGVGILFISAPFSFNVTSLMYDGSAIIEPVVTSKNLLPFSVWNSLIL